MKLLQKILLVLLFIASVNSSFAQEKSILFLPNSEQAFGMDYFEHKEWKKNYPIWKNTVNTYFTAFKSLAPNTGDIVDAQTIGIPETSFQQMRFVKENSSEKVGFIKKTSEIVSVFLPKSTENYTVFALFENDTLGKLMVEVLPVRKVKVVLIPLVNQKINKDSLQFYVNKIYRQANVQFIFELRKQFTSADIDPEIPMAKPSVNNEQYTQQMRNYRDLYFTANGGAPKNNELILFICPEFVDSTQAYFVKNKALGFVSFQKERNMSLALVKQLGFGYGHFSNSWENKGPDAGTTKNLMDETNETQINREQWQQLQQISYIYSYFDNYEEIKSSTGIVAYYFWQEDASGNILVDNKNHLLSIKRPFKKNTFSYHLEINNWLYKTLFTIKSKVFNLLHCLAVLVAVFLWIWLGRKFRAWIKLKMNRSWIPRFLSRIVFFGVFLALGYFLIQLIDLGYSFYEVRNGEVAELKEKSMPIVIQEIAVNHHPKRLSENGLKSEILVKQKETYTLKQRKSVLYFDVTKNLLGNVKNIKLSDSKDSVVLPSKGINLVAKSHYFVFRYKDVAGALLEERIFNHAGIDLTQKLSLSDPAKRILVFVNGYRPTSLGASFEDNFNDIKNKGLEYPNSFNQIFEYDRYDYWHPWNTMDDLFKNRVNPSQVFYADGHFSVTTSNHRTLINFSKLSATYPKRCVNPKKHQCYFQKSLNNKMFGSKRSSTYSMLPTKANKKGFRERFAGGKIAGRNLLQQLNEMPNFSENDTLFIVAHSMGYAYSLGMVEELRGKIQFGSYYILSPENAASGEVKPTEWQQIWQFGSRLGDKFQDAPCLQDGVAPQSKAKGLPNKNHIFIPEKNYKSKGFFNSHFVGYYGWIFELSKKTSGNISQH